ncbi:MAG: zinc metalloprotease HtpX [Neisseriales bacterium]|nr:MAG: zinc metalloprotease HtpX [Neisseriales bacterium]
MNINNIKTILLMASIVMLFGLIGQWVGGQKGMLLALGFGGFVNLLAWWNSDKMVLRLYSAKEITSDIAESTLYTLVKELAVQAKIPMPRVYIIEEAQPNAFATGRSPNHASVAATTGLLSLLNKHELRGVMAHELAHIIHRDTLIATVCATLAGAISMLAHFAIFFGGNKDEEGRHSNPLLGLLIAILAPIAAALIQMAISRSREFDADREGAKISNDPLSLANALTKIESYANKITLPSAIAHPETAQMMIINPLSGVNGVVNLFRTHPLTVDRVARLQKIASV